MLVSNEKFITNYRCNITYPFFHLLICISLKIDSLIVSIQLNISFWQTKANIHDCRNLHILGCRREVDSVDLTAYRFLVVQSFYLHIRQVLVNICQVDQRVEHTIHHLDCLLGSNLHY